MSLLIGIFQQALNTLYPAVWNRGATLHPSRVVHAAGGPRRNRLTSLPLLPFQNTLGSFVHHAHRQHLRIMPWFEYGLWIPENSAIARAHPDWLTRTIEGKATAIDASRSRLPKGIRDLKQEWTGTNQAWLNPAHPEVQSFFTNLIIEVVKKYDVDGIQLDDHFGIPVAFGYDDYTVKLYQQSHSGQPPPSNPNDPEWVAWRAEHLTQLMTKIATEVRSLNPNLIISLSPSPPKFAYEQYLQDWMRWADLGLIDEVLVQVYREQPSFLRAELNRQDFWHLRETLPIGIGLYTGPRNNAKSIEQIQQEVEITQAAGYEHVSFFCWETTFWLLKESSAHQVKSVFQHLFSVLPTFAVGFILL